MNRLWSMDIGRSLKASIRAGSGKGKNRLQIYLTDFSRAKATNYFADEKAPATLMQRGLFRICPKDLIVRGVCGRAVFVKSVDESLRDLHRVTTFEIAAFKHLH